MLSASPRVLPAGKLRSAVVAFLTVHSLPAPGHTFLHRYLYRFGFHVLIINNSSLRVNTFFHFLKQFSPV